MEETLNLSGVKTKKELQPGITKICVIRQKNKKGEIEEYNLFYGNAVYINDKPLCVKDDLYYGKLQEFLESDEGKKYKVPNQTELAKAYNEARDPKLVEMHRDKPQEQGPVMNAKSLMNDFKNAEYNPASNSNPVNQKKKAEASKAKELSLNNLVDEKLKLEARKKDLDAKDKELRAFEAALDKREKYLNDLQINNEAVKKKNEEKEAHIKEASDQLAVATAELNTRQTQLEDHERKLSEAKEKLDKRAADFKENYARFKEERQEFDDQQRQALAAKNYTGKIALATGIATASFVVAGFLVLCAMHILPFVF